MLRFFKENGKVYSDFSSQNTFRRIHPVISRAPFEYERDNWDVLYITLSFKQEVLLWINNKKKKNIRRGQIPPWLVLLPSSKTNNEKIFRHFRPFYQTNNTNYQIKNVIYFGKKVENAEPFSFTFFVFMVIKDIHNLQTTYIF